MPSLLRATSPRRQPRSRWLVAALAALALHAALFGLLLLLSNLRLGPDSSRPPAQAVALRSISPQRWAASRGQAPSPADGSRAQPPLPREKPPAGQVVETAPGNQQRPTDSEYLSESNNKVERQTRAREQTAFYERAAPQRTSPTASQTPGQDQAPRELSGGNGGVGKDSAPMSQAGQQRATAEVPAARRKEEPATRTPDEDGPGSRRVEQPVAEARDGTSSRLALNRGTAGGAESSQGSAGQRGPLNLMPPPSVLGSASGAAPNDLLQDVEVGDATLLNTAEWKHAGFFNRVKHSVSTHWNPVGALQLRDPTGNIYSGRDRMTVLTVTLRDDGSLQGAQIERSSGLDFLDEEAVGAFQRAQPFPNPPPGMMAPDGTITFQFSFFVEMGSGLRVRLLRTPQHLRR